MIKPEKIKLYMEISVLCGIILSAVLSIVLGALVKFYIQPVFQNIVNKEIKYIEYCFDEIMTNEQKLEALERFTKYKETGFYIPVVKSTGE